MRARGASVTDIVVLVVAADDGVMPQTKEAIAHAKAAKVPIIVAVNKIDKPARRPRARQARARRAGPRARGVGRRHALRATSAPMTGEGVDKLLESIAAPEPRSSSSRPNPKRSASGTVLEALLDRGRGPVARVLVQDGTLRVGDFVLAGAGFGKVRAMTNEHGKQRPGGRPGDAGRDPRPQRGAQRGRSAWTRSRTRRRPRRSPRAARGRWPRASSRRRRRCRSRSSPSASPRADSRSCASSSRATCRARSRPLADALAKLSTEKVRLSIIHAAVGAITEGDVNLAIASRAIIVGFNVRPAGKASSLAEENKIEIRLYSIIYNALEDVKRRDGGPARRRRSSRSATARPRSAQIFKVKGVAVAGCYVTEGKIVRSGKMRLLRDGAVVWDGKIASLKRFKDDAREVPEGHRVRHQPRGLQRHQGEGHPRVLRGRGDQAEALVRMLERSERAD